MTSAQRVDHPGLFFPASPPVFTAIGQSSSILSLGRRHGHPCPSAPLLSSSSWEFSVFGGSQAVMRCGPLAHAVSLKQPPEAFLLRASLFSEGESLTPT